MRAYVRCYNRLHRAIGAHHSGELDMAKGQLRSNKEAKKPKQNKTKPLPGSSTTGTPIKPGLPPQGKKR
jgi:hypothetical protein